MLTFQEKLKEKAGMNIEELAQEADESTYRMGDHERKQMHSLWHALKKRAAKGDVVTHMDIAAVLGILDYLFYADKAMCEMEPRLDASVALERALAELSAIDDAIRHAAAALDIGSLDGAAERQYAAVKTVLAQYRALRQMHAEVPVWIDPLADAAYDDAADAASY